MPRKLALSVLYEITEKDAYSDLALKKSLDKTDLDVRDKALCANIVYGTIQYLRFLDYQITTISGRPLKAITPEVRNILRLSLYQLRFLTRIPPHAVCDEAVKLTKKKAFSASGFVNAVLRKTLREGWQEPKNPRERLGVHYAYPTWLVTYWADLYGEKVCEELLAAGNREAPLTVRINGLKITKEEFLKRCQARESVLNMGVYPEEITNIAASPLFTEGFCTVQDIAAQKAAITLDPKPGEKVLDMCAAPGGKTTHMAELMQNQGEILAWDLHSHKISLIQETAKRLGISIITAKEHDARVFDEALCGCFDKVLVDAPCSGLGVIRKKPDIKWKRKLCDIAALCEEQADILEKAAHYVKPGGEMVYSTCTLSKEENEDMADMFLKTHPSFERVGDYETFFPHIHNTDGFFIAKFRRKQI